jgi:hypothetical protein
MMPLRSLLLGLLSVCLLAACEPGNSLKSFSGRHLRAVVLPPSGTDSRTQVVFKAELVLKEPESGCLQLHPGVEATLDGIPLKVTPGVALTRDGPCSDPELWPTFINRVDAALFLGEPRNAVLEIRDGGDRIVVEYRNLFARHTFQQLSPAPTVKPGEEVFLPWDPPTDDLTLVTSASLDTVGVVPVRPEEGGVRLTIPPGFPEGPVQVSTRASVIPAERCEGVALCTATSLLFVPRVVQVRVQN